MSDTYTVKDVTSDLRFLLSLTKLFEADDEGYWILADTKKRFLHKLDSGDAPREIILLQDPMPRGDHLIFNPYSEGYGKPNPATKLYYNTMRVALNETITTVMIHAARAVLTTKEAAKAEEDHTVPMAVVRVSSVPVGRRQTIYDVIDEEMIEEFKKLFERVNHSLIHIPYYAANMTAKVTCEALTGADFDAKFGKDIRKRSMAAFKALLMGVLGITKPEELADFNVKYQTSWNSAPRFHATMSVIHKLYTQFNDLIADAYAVEGKSTDQFEVDLGTFHQVIERFPLAYAIGKHMIQPALTSVAATSTQTSDTSSLRFAQPAANAAGSQSGGRRFAGPPVVDAFGRLGGPAQTVPQLGFGNNGGFGQPQPQNRFRPHVLNETPVDPLAPVTRPVQQSSFGGFGNTGFGGGPQMGFGQGGGFGQQQLNMGGGLNLNPPSNFGDPGTRRWFP